MDIDSKITLKFMSTVLLVTVVGEIGQSMTNPTLRVLGLFAMIAVMFIGYFSIKSSAIEKYHPKRC